MNLIRRYIPAVLSVTFVLLLWTNASAKDWRGIVPLKSSRADVERLLGKPTTDRGDWTFYKKETERIAIVYSRGPCSVELSPWNVAKGIVIEIWVTPLSKVLFTNLNVDQVRFKKLADYHVGWIAHYVGEEDGIEYEVNENEGTVTLITYLPTAADEMLRCPESPNLLKQTIMFERYSDISFAAEKEKLDKFAEQLTRYTLKEHASVEGYILAYGRKDEVLPRAERAKTYLTKIRRVSAGRIVIRHAQVRMKPTIELYLVPAGGPTPLFRPD